MIGIFQLILAAILGALTTNIYKRCWAEQKWEGIIIFTMFFVVLIIFATLLFY